MKILTNGFVAKCMDEFMADIYANIDNEQKAEWVYENWLAYGVPDESDYADYVDMYGNQESFDELKKTFKSLLNYAGIKYTDFQTYVEEKSLKDFYEMLDKSLDK